MTNEIDEMLYKTSQRDRLKELAYFMLHNELLKNEFYNCIYQKLVDMESNLLTEYSYDNAKRMVEILMYITLDIYGEENIEAFKFNVDYLANLVKKQNATL